MHEAVSAVIPGASRQEQVLSNIRAASLPPLSREQMEGVAGIYDRHVRNVVHSRW